MSSNYPVLKPISWLSAIPQLLVYLILLIAANYINVYYFNLRFEYMVIATAVTYIVISIFLRRLIPRNQRNGMRYFKKEEYDKALEEFMKSYEFFKKHVWLDKYRYLVLLSSNKISYREMALINIAACYAQLGDGFKSKENYERVLDEFPESGIAKAALKMFEVAGKYGNSSSEDL